MDEVITADRLSTIIGWIYDCALDPARWSDTIDAIRGELGFANASLDLMLLPEGTSLLNRTVNIPEPFVSRMLDYAPHIVDMWGGYDTFLSLPLDEPAVLTRVVSDRDRLWQHPMFLDWAQPQGLNDILALWLARDAGAVGVIAFGWPAAAGAIGDRELRLARLLIPHLQRAASINRLLDVSALQRATFAALFDTLSVPILVADVEMNFVSANVAGRRILAEKDPVQIRAGKVHCPDLAVERALGVAVQAADDKASIGRRGIGIPVRSGHGGLGALYVLPLRPEVLGDVSGLPSSRPIAAIFLARAATASIVAPNLVAALFGFTNAESKVFELIVVGATVADAAKTLKVRESTVKTHLLRIYDKTGLRRQGDLIRMAGALAAPAMIQ